MAARPFHEPFFLLGATAVGKSAVAMAWARQAGAAILALDAMQVYCGADIGTGKPTAAERAEIPHGGLDLAEVGEGFHVARYLSHAAEFLRNQQEAGRRVLIVGGTGLYYRALTRGLCDAPQAPEALRAELSALSVTELRARLAKVDPHMLPRIDAANPRRLVRAIEVVEATGRSLHAWQEETAEPLVPAGRAYWLQRDKIDLESRIEARIEIMLALGWMDEVKSLIKAHGVEKVRGFPAIGYRQIADLLAGHLTREAARREITTATRQYAKRQLTWFAREPSLRKMLLADSQLPEFPPI